MSLKLPIYLDNAATTKIDPRVLEKMLPFLTEEFGNAASRTHRYGWTAEKAIEEARKQIATTIACQAQEIIWTAGATQSINLAIKNTACAYQHDGKHIITLATEHNSTLRAMRDLEHNGFIVTYLTPQSNGLIAIEDLIRAIRPDTILISIMLVNNEIGVVQDIAAISDICNSKQIIFHVDAAQAIGKLEFSLENIDLMSFSAHKAYGPKGIGALYISKSSKIALTQQIRYENELISGTLPTAQIVGMGEAFILAQKEMAVEVPRIYKLRNQLLHGLKNIEEVYIHGDLDKRVPHNLNLSFKYIEGESLLMELQEIAISNGSACNSAELKPSHVLQALGIDKQIAQSAIRIGIGRFNTEEEIDYTINLITKKVFELRELSPHWEMFKNGLNV